METVFVTFPRTINYERAVVTNSSGSQWEVCRDFLVRCIGGREIGRGVLKMWSLKI